MIVERALEIKKELIRGDKYFYGPKEVLRIYKQRHTDWKVPSIDFIKRVCRANGLVKKINKRQAGRSCYQHYPAHTIETLSDSISELDFVGEKYINGQTEPINIISYNSLYPFKYREFAMVLSQTSKEAINFLAGLWERISTPNVLKVDNDLAFIGSASAKRSLSRFVIFLLNRGVSPLFISPRSPWNNSSIEGGNNVFGTKFWNRYTFTSVKDIIDKLVEFNKSYQEYLEFSNDLPIKKIFQKAKHIYFVRKVLENKDNGYIDILNEHITLSGSYINQFVFSEWDLEKQLLKIQYENEKKLILVKDIQFKINSNLV
ncbi:MAG TPA: hypothetical protein DHW81_08245 [Nitrospiraceae bacterium]|nr:hypothetical protein [Nitrospiraceae bacterium]